MKQYNRKIGKLGEKIAVNFLKNKNFIILKQNFANKFGEIDIIAKDKEVVVFVEVKTKIGIDFGQPEEMITPGKLKKIRMMGSLYLGDQKLSCRIDAVAIVLMEDLSIERLNHYENVY